MPAEIDIEICAGTTCFVWGGSELLLLPEQLPGRWKNRVNVRGTTCLHECKNTTLKPPFVRINGKLHGDMDLTGLMTLIETMLEDAHAV